MRNLYQKVNKYVPLGAILIFVLTAFSALIYLLCAIFERFADFVNSITFPVRAILSIVTSIIPISIVELVLITMPIWATVLIVFAVKNAKKGKIATIRYLCIIISIICVYFISFVWTFASGYHTTPIERKLNINREGIKAEELYDALELLTNEINLLTPRIEYDESGASVMPYSYKEMSKRVSSAYKKMADETGLLKTFKSRAKPILFSDIMAYTHISGVYTCITGEANINVAYADYIVASTSAHEMAHQRGIAREDEASFVGFLALSHSDDAFLKYSAYLDVYYYLLSDLLSSSPELARDVYAKLSPLAKADRNACIKKFEKYQDSLASKVSDKVNDSYLQANGDKDGTQSYNLVSELVCSYLVRE